MKNKGMKVKRRRRSFYKKRKSTGRKILEVILIILLIAALIFIGYSVAPPLIKFLSGEGNTSSTSEPVWTPPETTTTQSESVTTTTPPTTTEKPEEKPVLLSGNAVTAPSTALSGTTALNSYLEGVKKAGYTTVIFNLKDDTGRLLYKSTVSTVKDNNNIVTGKLTAAQIVSISKTAGITPVAFINTLEDHLISTVVGEAGYTTTGNWGWLDASPEKGGKPWATPYSEEAVSYLSDISKELSKAGFEGIILNGVKFPKFGNYDYSLLPAYLKESNRAEKLVSLINKCSASADKSHTTVNIDAAQLLTVNKSVYKGTAEIWKYRSNLSKSGLLVTLDVNTLGTTLTISDSETLKVDKDITKAVASVFGRVRQLAGNTEIAVGISGSEKLTAAQKKDVENAFKKLGYKNIVLT
ncbi:MAG: hypothetical protein IJZ51_07185 [Ruminiclostridium sp.]|nr:hypothetical protein [Ruminiclostridium sp.]